MRITSFLLSLALLLPAAGAAWAQSQTISVEQNTSQLLRLPKPAATLVVGKPSIADVTLENEQLLLLHGVNPGSTNLIALDDRGQVMLSADINVIVPQKEYMFLHRGGTATGVYDCRSARCVPSEGGAAASGSLLEQLLPGQLGAAAGDN